MKKFFGIVGILLILASIGMIVGGFAMNNWRSPVEYSPEEYVSEQTLIDDINIELWNGSLEIVYGDEFKLEYFINDFSHFEFVDENKSFSVKETSPGKWINLFSFLYQTPNVKLTLPSTNKVQKLTIKNTSGNVTLCGSFDELDVRITNGAINYSDGSADDISLKTTNGDISIKDIRATSPNDDILLESTNGSIFATNITAEAGISASTTNGKISFEEVISAGTIGAELTNGSITVNKIYFKVGSFKTTNGSVIGTINGKQRDYTITLNTTNGKTSPRNQTGGEYVLTASTTNGDVKFSFTQPD